ncbi:ABC transporter ATP-binding protein [Pseudomonas sp. HY2-MNA-CIBAN-0224]|uniref:ABC transporter ATP-binding protein n=1 Tax=Pseudomonas sp. HY2-MNA-CIBAN-0224 TaxID=3140471 RepID=UPI003325726D
MNSPILLTDDKLGLPEPAAHPEVQLAPTPTYAMEAKLIRVSAGSFRFEVRDLHFRRGRHTAIIGPNGAGKTTLIEALLGFRQAHLEGAQILGVEATRFLQSTRHRQRLGVQLQRVEYEDSSNVREILDLHLALYGKQDPQVAQALDIEALRKLPYRALSRGQKQRLDLFVALAHHPELAVLDEPFTGLDRAYIERVAHLLRYDLAGLTIIMICHSVEELDAASDVVWVCNGGVEYRGDKESLKNRLVGAFHAYLQLDDVDQVNAIYHLLQRQSATLRLSMPSRNEISVYGTQELEPSIRRLIGNVAFQHCEFGPTHYRDMLHLCAQGELDA